MSVVKDGAPILLTVGILAFLLAIRLYVRTGLMALASSCPNSASVASTASSWPRFRAACFSSLDYLAR